MKGIVLAGGFGTRLEPMTLVTNKHLLPIYDRPMIYYPLQTLVKAGIDEIMLVTGGKHAGDFLELLGGGKRLGIRELNYTYQEGAGGIPVALSLAEDFADDDPICVILGDNVTDADLTDSVRTFEHGAKVFLKEVDDPKRFGIAELEGGVVTSIIEKPANPRTNLAVTGIYMYDHMVWDMIRTLKPSKRGELEITDINNNYISIMSLGWGLLNGWWKDAGTKESMLEASMYMSKVNK